MKKVSGAQANPTLMAIIYGQSKMLKTTTYLLAPPEFRPIGVLDCDRGARLRLAVLGCTEEQRKTLGVVPSTIYDTAGPWVREGIEFYYPDPKNAYGDAWEFATKVPALCKTVVVDSTSRLADMLLDEVVRTPYEGVREESKDPRVKMTSGGLSSVHPTLSDFGVAQDRVMTIVQLLLQSPANVLLISHEKTGEVKDAEGVKRILSGPRTVGNALIEVLPSVVDLVLRFETQARTVPVPDPADPKRVSLVRSNVVVVRSRNHGIYLAGDRSGLFSDGEELVPAVFWKKISQLLHLASMNGTPPEAAMSTPSVASVRSESAGGKK